MMWFRQMAQLSTTMSENIHQTHAKQLKKYSVTT